MMDNADKIQKETPMGIAEVGATEARPRVTRYPTSPWVTSQIEDKFTFHAPKHDQVDRYEKIRRLAKAFALELVELCPPSPERTGAIEHLQEAVMSANASIAINEE